METATTSSFDLRTTAGRFRLVALVEAISWVGLLIGMYFKRVHSSGNEIGVQVFGPVHGVVFLAFLAVGLAAGLAFQWSPATWLLALLGSIVPLGSVIFLIWADRAAKLGPAPAAARAGGLAPEAT